MKDLTPILATAGALAWLPHLFMWFYIWLVKPVIRFLPESKAEIGYTTLGPIINIFFAISTSKKDALIDKISLSLVHSSGDRQDFWWSHLDEKGFAMTAPTGETAEFRKNQPAIALKVNMVGLAEKKIFFQNFNFFGKANSLYLSAIEKRDHLKRTKEEAYIDKALKTEEYLKFSDYYKDKFPWKEGTYTITLYVHEVTLKRPHRETFQFILSKSNVDMLKENILTAQDECKKLIRFEKDIKKEDKPEFKWVFPTLSKAK